MTESPLAIDLFCGQGGASAGLVAAGFRVIGVDIERQPHYPYEFVQADALACQHLFPAADLIWASPKCQKHTPLAGMWNGKAKTTGDEHEDQIPETRDMLIASGKPYVIENVIGAPLRATIMLCGTMFGLGTKCGAQLRRHRNFETSFMVMQPTCDHRGRTVGVYGEYVRDSSTDTRRRTVTVAGDSVSGKTRLKTASGDLERHTYTVDDARDAMGMPWGTIAGLSQAIPPAYAEYLGRAFLQGR